MPTNITTLPILLAGLSLISFFLAVIDITIGQSVGCGFILRILNRFAARREGYEYSESGNLDAPTETPIFATERALLYWFIVFMKIVVGALLATPLLLEIFRYVESFR